VEVFSEHNLEDFCAKITLYLKSDDINKIKWGVCKIRKNLSENGENSDKIGRSNEIPNLLFIILSKYLQEKSLAVN
jgi:hypothetical protein